MKHELTPEILQGIGLLVTRWAHIEEYLGRWVAHLVKGDQSFMYLLTKDASSANLIKWIRALMPLRYQQVTVGKSFDEFIVEIDAARVQRNAYVHALWAMEDDAPTATAQTLDWNRAEIIQTTLVTTADLDEFATELVHILAEIRRVAVAFKFVSD